MQPRYSSDGELYGLEENVFGFVERYVRSLNGKQSQDFMRYVSGSDIIQNKIYISFNGITNLEEMIPKAHACGVDMEVSRFLHSFEQLKLYMDNIFASPAASEGFHVL